MRIIDAHIHFSNILEFHHTAQELAHINYSSQGILKEFADAGVVLGVGMGLTESTKGGFPDREALTPMGLDLEESLPPQIVYCLGINPYKLDREQLIQVEQDLQKPEVVGIKIYLGYYPFYAYDEVYKPVYELAMKYSVPVVFHTGDTYSERGLLKYSHPLTLDEVAVEYREINFMMAHMGDPWVLDGAELIYKNRNLYADLSGLIVGAKNEVEDKKARSFAHLQHALAYNDRFDKLIFGTDWPLVQIQPYIDFVKELVPTEFHQAVFYDTAVKVFPKIKPFLK